MLYVYTLVCVHMNVYMNVHSRMCVRERPDSFILAYLPIVIVSIYFLKTCKLINYTPEVFHLET